VIKIIKGIVISFALIILVSACATKKEIYHWGEYESLIQSSYLEPGTADAALQIQKITADIEKAKGFGKKIPPGIYAHLGYMYAIEGNVTKSNEAFLMEKDLFPESALFIDGMLERAKAYNKEKTL
jgi:hypothetical protein